MILIQKKITFTHIILSYQNNTNTNKNIKLKKSLHGRFSLFQFQRKLCRCHENKAQASLHLRNGLWHHIGMLSPRFSLGCRAGTNTRHTKMGIASTRSLQEPNMSSTSVTTAQFLTQPRQAMRQTTAQFASRESPVVFLFFSCLLARLLLLLYVFDLQFRITFSIINIFYGNKNIQQSVRSFLLYIIFIYIYVLLYFTQVSYENYKYNIL